MDHEGTDTYKFREAGAEGIAIASPGRTAMLMEAELELASLIHLYSDFDLVLVEGYKMHLIQSSYSLGNGGHGTAGSS